GTLVDRPLFLTLKKDDRSARVANVVAERLNLIYQDDAKKAHVSEMQKQLLLMDDVMHQLNQKHTSHGSSNIARARKDYIEVCVPYAYRFNRQRYLRVARLAPLSIADGEAMARYRKRLHKMLLDPADTIRASLRLEALGSDSIPVLKEGLGSTHPLIRFACAEALTYL